VIRVSPAQFSLLEANLRAGGTAPARGRRREDLPENVLERQICDFLAWRGFLSTRQHVGTFVPYRVLKQAARGDPSVIHIGETGAADWWSARPIIPPGGRALDGPHSWQGFFWEGKAPGRRPTEAQLAWLERRRQVGFEATWFSQFQAADRLLPAGLPRRLARGEVIPRERCDGLTELAGRPDLGLQSRPRGPPFRIPGRSWGA
jgi:hypothetical protein